MSESEERVAKVKSSSNHYNLTSSGVKIWFAESLQSAALVCD